MPTYPNDESCVSVEADKTVCHDALDSNPIKGVGGCP